jgi:hypothetical protein
MKTIFAIFITHNGRVFALVLMAQIPCYIYVFKTLSNARKKLHRGKNERICNEH